MAFLIMVIHFLLIIGIHHFELSKLILSHSMDTVGTICADCKDLPDEVKKKVKK